MPCYSPIPIRNKRVSDVNLGRSTLYRLVPCGKCLGCLRVRQMQYVFRMEWEALDPRNKDLKFITLTYAPEFLPLDNELSKSEVQNFVRRLKRITDDKVVIRYFFCGEHGSPVFTERAHYHGILFCSDYVPSSAIVRAWPYGRVDVSDVSLARFGYVAKYSLKQLGDGSEKWIQPPFMLVSNSLGFYFLEKHGEYCRKNYIDSWMNASGYAVNLPRVFMDRLFPPCDKVHGLQRISSDAAGVYYRRFVGNRSYLDLVHRASYDARVTIASVKRGVSVSAFEGYRSLGNSFIHANKRESIFNRVRYETGRY